MIMEARRHRFYVLYRKRVALFSTILAVIFVFLLLNSPAIMGASATKRELPIYCVQRDNKAVSLTFDAAWGNEDTQMLIDILGRYHVKATFFVVGFWVEKFPESVKALADAGHEVMNHSDDHAHMNQLSADRIASNITACNNKIAKVTGVTPTLFRCPYGEYDDHVIKALRSMNMQTIQWDVDSLDWKNLTAPEIAQRVTSRVQPGSIVLFHNAALHTPEALPPIIEYLIKNGYSIVPVSQLIIKGDYTIDHTGRQFPA
jgi:polysaccharide deacetylase family sporulation protein PdaB